MIMIIAMIITKIMIMIIYLSINNNTNIINTKHTIVTKHY